MILQPPVDNPTTLSYLVWKFNPFLLFKIPASKAKNKMYLVMSYVQYILINFINYIHCNIAFLSLLFKFNGNFYNNLFKKNKKIFIGVYNLKALFSKSYIFERKVGLICYKMYCKVTYSVNV